MILFSAILPHAPILLPGIGTKEDKEKLKKSLEALSLIGKKFKEKKIEKIIISSPHLDWGFNVPLYFLLSSEKDFKITKIKAVNREKIEPLKGKVVFPFLTTDTLPESHFLSGKEFFQNNKEIIEKENFALVASGDLSHRLKKEGPYGFHPEGPAFDKELILSLKEKNIKKILQLDKLYPFAGECGLRSISFILGIMEGAKINWKTEILSYEGPFGVGYLVCCFSF
jgi:aromatic ring-opening dioxygenase LigB subunit